MNPTTPRKDPKEGAPDAAQDEAADRPSAGDSGGAPASEEDIGTEGEGTEPPSGG